MEKLQQGDTFKMPDGQTFAFDKEAISMRTEVGKRLRIIRKQKGISTAEMAERCGVTSSGIRMMEQGQRYPSIDRLVRLAIAMDMTCRDLFKEVGMAADGAWPDPF